MFHPKAGGLVVLSNGNKTAQRIHPSQEFNNGLVMSLEPLRDNLLFEVRIDKKVGSWTGTIEIGVTTCDPNVLQFPMTAAMLPAVTWLVSGVSVLRDGQPIVEDYVQNLECLGEGDTVGVMKTSEGELHFYVNGLDQGMAVANVPSKVYAVIDLYGKCAQVTALETTNESRIHSNALSNSRNNNTPHINNNNNDADDDCDDDVTYNNTATASANVNKSVTGNDANSAMSDKLRFHERTGTLVKLTSNRRTAERKRPEDEFNNGIVMTHRPLRDNELFEIRIDRLVDKWSGSIEVGITTHNPVSLEFPATMTNMRSGTIMMSGCGILTNGKGTRREYGAYNLDELKEGHCISLMRKSNGNLHYYINGIDQGVAASNVPATVFAVVDLYGMTVKVSIVDHDDRLEQGLANHRNNLLVREYHLLNGSATSDEVEDDRLLFDARCGSHAAVINGGKSAHRPIAVEDFDNAVVLTNRPLRSNELFEVRLDAVVPKWAGSIEIGVTTHSPRLLEFPSTMTNLCSGNWMMTGKGVMHNGMATIEEYGQNLDRLTVGNRVGVLRKENGALHFFVNGIDQGVAATNVPEKVFGVVDLYGQATRCTIVDIHDSSFDSTNAVGCPSYSPSCELRFHHLRGRNARITNGGLVASRPNSCGEFNDAIVISNRPLRDNEMFEVVMDKMVDRWSGSIEAGVTAIKPENLEFPSTMTDIDYDTWMLSGSAVMQNGLAVRNGYKCDLDSLGSNSRVGMMRHSDATLHYYINGEDMGVACTDIPQNVYAVIDLYGQCSQVTIIPLQPSMTDSITSPPTHTETLRLSCGETTDAIHRFSTYCGKNVTLSNNSSVATRVCGFSHGLVFGSSILQSNELFEVQIQQMSRRYSGSLRIGLTTLHYTDGLPTTTLPCSASQLPETSGDTWLLIGTQVRHNSTVLRDNYGPSMDRLDVGDRVGIKRCTDGTLHAFYNGQDMGIAAVNLSKKLYAVVDLYGSIEKVAIVSKACGGLITPVEIRDHRASSHSSHSRDSLEDNCVQEFHEIHGRNVVLSSGNTVARRSASYNQGVVFSRKPLVKGQIFQFRLDRLNTNWSSSLLVGVTTHSPCRGTLLVTALDLQKSTWIVCGDSVFHNAVKVKARYGPNLDNLQARHTVGVLVDANNELHLFVNRLDQGVAAKDVPQPCYAVVDLYGQCEELTVISTDSSASHVIDTNHCEKANFEHDWKEKVLKPPLVDQLPVKNCEYQNVCNRFKSSLGLPDGYFLPEHSICYCDTCYKIRGDEAYYRKGEPPKDYAVPFGWCQFSLRIPAKAEGIGTLDKWHVAFHGTRPAIIRHILDCGDLLIPEADLCSISRSVSSKNKSKDVDDEAIQICFSPTIRYVANSTFTPKFEFADSKTKKRYFARCAFQVLAQPGAYNSGPQRLGAREPIDGHFSNSDIEWFTKERGATILHSLLVRIEDL